MAIGPRLELRQSQALVMTPQLMQAIKLLQLSTVDLAAYLAEELDKNPLLEAAEGETPATAPDAGEGVDGAVEAAAEWAPEGREEIEARLGTELGNVFPDDPAPAAAPDRPAATGVRDGGGAGGGGEGGDANLEAFVAASTTLADHLDAQLGLAIADPARRVIGRGIVDSLDAAGYLTEPLDELARRLGAPVSVVEAVLAVVQTLDPSGIGARSLQECLAIQLRERDRLDPAMAALLDHLPLLAKGDMAALRRLCGVDAEDLADMIAELRRLDPKPGHAFGAEPVQPVVPDVFVRAGPGGVWQVELNTEVLPRVLVNQIYYAEVSRQARSGADKAFLSECYANANWLTRSLEQRARTILKVVSEIVRQQDGFLTHGVAHLRPLNLKAVALAIGMHESTVSRVTANKYVATPRGTFELKYFFTPAIAGTDGGATHSAEAVRHRIRAVIAAEPEGQVFSDDEIVRRLEADGIAIARRTVAKYRESLGIPSSSQRRREKAMRG
ncbi:MAG TPA: RNA polymerase factor sigma-54 [Hyphomicrobiales bacterium]|nr:RNA polymerase factor sigma-54 [Hyphomicrobiales bacterium]